MIEACKICHSLDSRNIFSFDRGFFSDGSQSNYPLQKDECCQCGTIRTRLADINLDLFYKTAYSPSRNIDTPAVYSGEEMSRSRFVFSWIKSFLNNDFLESTQSIMEIGCGQGLLLEQFDVANKFGVEPSEKACQQAKAIANVRCIGYEEISNKEQYDLVISYCVIEHIIDPNYFLEKNRAIVSDNGLVIIALPIQDKFNYDLLFADHLHHFSHFSFNNLLTKNGLSIVDYQLGKDSYSNIAIYVCKKSNRTLYDYRFDFIKNKNIKKVSSILDYIEKIGRGYKDKELYAFGYGEIAKTVLPYTSIGNIINYYIDDYAIGNKIITSAKSKEIFRKKEKINMILLVNIFHVDKVKEIYKEFEHINYINIFDVASEL